MSKLKFSTSKIINFHVVIQILRNRRLTHTNFYLFKKFIKVQKLKSNTFERNQLSYFLNNIQNWSVTRSKYSIFMLSSKYSVFEDSHTNFHFFENFIKMQIVKSNTLTKINYHIFEEMWKMKCNTSKILNFHVVLKILRSRRLTHTNFNLFKEILKNVKSED